MNKYEITINGMSDRIITPVTIDVTDYPTKEGSINKKLNVQALWDTGATVTVVSEELVKELCLTPRGITKVSGFDGTPVFKNTFKIDVKLNDINIDYVDAIEAPLLHSDILLGMNVIGYGNLHIVHRNYKTTDLKFELF